MTTDLKFDPEELVILAGDTIVWKNTSPIPHTATFNPAEAKYEKHVQLPDGVKSFGSGILQQEESYRKTFETAGEYRYFCIPHEQAGMTGRITVQEAGK